MIVVIILRQNSILLYKLKWDLLHKSSGGIQSTVTTFEGPGPLPHGCQRLAIGLRHRSGGGQMGILGLFLGPSDLWGLTVLSWVPEWNINVMK